MKETGEIEYDPKDPLMGYHGNYSNSCCFSSLASILTVSEENSPARDILMLIEQSLHCRYKVYKDRIAFSNAVMKEKVRKLGDKHLNNNINVDKTGQVWRSSWHQLKCYLGTVIGQCQWCQSCSEYSPILEIWLQLQMSLPLTLDSLNIIYYPSELEGMFSMFETVFHAVKHIHERGKLNISE